MWPVVQSLFMRLTTDTRARDLRNPFAVDVIGVDNYVKALSDPTFLQAARNTAYFVIVGVPLTLVMALAAAVALDRGITAACTSSRAGAAACSRSSCPTSSSRSRAGRRAAGASTTRCTSGPSESTASSRRGTATGASPLERPLRRLPRVRRRRPRSEPRRLLLRQGEDQLRRRVRGLPSGDQPHAAVRRRRRHPPRVVPRDDARAGPGLRQPRRHPGRAGRPTAAAGSSTRSRCARARSPVATSPSTRR